MIRQVGSGDCRAYTFFVWRVIVGFHDIDWHKFLIPAYKELVTYEGPARRFALDECIVRMLTIKIAATAHRRGRRPTRLCNGGEYDAVDEMRKSAVVYSSEFQAIA